jgi:hypothetical protein
MVPTSAASSAIFSSARRLASLRACEPRAVSSPRPGSSSLPPHRIFSIMSSSFRICAACMLPRSWARAFRASDVATCAKRHAGLAVMRGAA